MTELPQRLSLATDELQQGGAFDALLVCDAIGGILYASSPAQRLLGLDQKPVVGRPLDELLRLGNGDAVRPGGEQIADICRRNDGASVVLDGGQVLDGQEVRLRCEVAAVDSRLAVIQIRADRDLNDARVLAYRASHDALTRLPNRANLQERLQLLHLNAVLAGTSYGLLLLDLDHFKIINDRFGHATGDGVLANVGQRLARKVREGDTVGRWGGEEFLFLLPRVGRSQAEEVAERVRRCIEETPVDHGGRQVRVTSSIGVAAYPDDGDHPDALLAKADAALYEAKRAGRNRVRCHTVGSAGVFSLANIVEQALLTGEVLPAYQSVVDLRTGEVRGEEALARIRLGDGSLMSAATFIPAAEQLNLVHRVDHRIIHSAVLRCVERTLRRDPVSAMFVNFSADFLRHPELVADILDTIKQKCAVCGDLVGQEKPLVVEITERQFLQDVTEAKQVLAPFVELGIRLAVDDFGAGYSTLHYFAELPIQFLKIEGSLVRRVGSEPRVRAVVQAIQSMAADMGVISVAEGIEDERTLDQLCEIGIDWGQGYLFSRPSVTPDAPDI